MDNIIYLYCVTEKAPELKELKSLDDNLHTIHHNSLYAVVSNVPQEEFDDEHLKKNLDDMEWLKNKAGLHETIIEGVMKEACVIPFRFATLFYTDDSLKTMLEKHGTELKMHLKNLQDKKEWGVKIYCDTGKLKKALIKEDEELLKIDKEIESASPGKAFLLKKKKDETLNKLVQARVNEYCGFCFERLSEESLKTHINRLLPKEVTERNDEMVFNVAFLVNQHNVNGFIEAVKSIQAIYEMKGISIDCTGPWPPYNFCILVDKTVLELDSIRKNGKKWSNPDDA